MGTQLRGGQRSRCGALTVPEQASHGLQPYAVHDAHWEGEAVDVALIDYH